MTSAIVHTPGAGLAPAPSARLGLLRPLAAPAEIIASQEEARALVADALKEGRDYGKIPGVDKPSLLKPGAERLALAFGCAARFRVVEQETDHDRVVEWVKRKKKWRNAHRGDREFTWEEERGTSLGLYRTVIECEIVHRESGTVVATCLGVCSTMESKYIDRPRDSENTVIKMAQKRALVGATLLAFGLSEQFTQDVEDGADVAGGAAAPTAQEKALAAANARIFPWPSHRKYGGKALSTVSTGMLLTVSKWCTEELESNKELSEADQQRIAALKADVVLILETRTDLDAAIAARQAKEAKDEEGEQRPDPTTPSSTSMAPAAPPATTSEPTVAELNAVANTAAAQAINDEKAAAAAAPAPVATVQELTTKVFNLLGDQTIIAATRATVRKRLTETDPLTIEILSAAIAELEANKVPF